ncbi:hypothetical protein Tsubulata_005568 [Turnera subulata]|uniref:Late embryogenesis abundant protein LEA-2 subgroup domain-containing protein n=1 Tax=Turnera subulata TaxID=218843 RepID=A0A9Q0F4X9_9ROSI|nr:hypothetical protein Tsubulata_005568 [Turnera subulata]
MASFKTIKCGSICQMVILVLALVAGAAILTVGLVMNSKYSPKGQQQPLVIRLNSFRVSDLNVSNSVSGANWDATLLFGNRHQVFEISIQTFETFVCYNHQDALSCALVEPLHLGPKKQKLVHISFNATGCGGGEQPFIEDIVLKQIKRDGDNGTLHVGLMLHLQVTFKKGPWSWVYELNPLCSGLDVRFMSGAGVGMITGDDPRPCSVPLLH